LRVLVYDIGEGPGCLVNPKLTRFEGEEIGTEGCLSMPGLRGEVPRAVTILCKGLDRNGKPVKFTAENLVARVLQHEVDHLNGVLFIDRAVADTLHWVVAEETVEV